MVQSLCKLVRNFHGMEFQCQSKKDNAACFFLALKGSTYIISWGSLIGRRGVILFILCLIIFLLSWMFLYYYLVSCNIPNYSFIAVSCYVILLYYSWNKAFTTHTYVAITSEFQRIYGSPCWVGDRNSQQHLRGWGGANNTITSVLGFFWGGGRVGHCDIKAFTKKKERWKLILQ